MPKKLKGTLIFVLLLALGGVSFLIWAENQGGDIPPVTEFAPNFWFDKDEKYFPADPLQFYYDENMQELPGKVAVENYNQLSLDEKLKNFTVFYKIDEKESEIIYQYWLFYVYNYGSNEHYGDWESVFVFVDKGNKKITRAIGSFHQGGAINTEISGDNLKDIKHVWDYVAEGSHANCPDYEADGSCNAILQIGFEMLRSLFTAMQFIDAGPRISYNSYKVTPLEDLKNKIGQDQLITAEKSPSLGSLPFKTSILNEVFGQDICNPCYALPVGGDSAQDAWTKAEYADSYAAQPWTVARATDWIGQNIETAYNFASGTLETAYNFASGILGNAYNFASDALGDIAGAAGDIFAQVGNFISFTPAGIGPAINNIAGGVSTNQSAPAAAGAAEEEFSGEQFSVKFTVGQTLNSMVDSLDDITEQIDILSRQIAALTGLPSVLGVSDTATTEEETQVIEKVTAPKTKKRITLATSGAPQAKQTYPKLMISEIYDSGTEEFVEIFNPNAFAVDLTGWYAQKATKSGDGYDSYAPKTLFEGKTIMAKDYFLVARNGTGWPGGVDAYTDYSLGSDNTLVLKDPNQDIVDRVGWGAAQDFETAPAPSPSENNSIGRAWNDTLQNYPDADNNSADFEIQALTPNEKNARHESTQDSQQTATSVQTYSKILISEVKAEGVTSKDEFIELYNGNASSVDLTGWALKKKTSSGTESNLVSASEFSGSIPANGYFLVVSQDATTTYPMADLTYSGSTYSFAKDNTILLYNPAETTVDKVGFGAALDFEGSVAENPTVENSTGRIWTATSSAYIDSDNNLTDFVLQVPTPKIQNEYLPENSSPEDTDGGPEPEAEPLPQTVVINEIAWMGTKVSANDEWIELYNNTAQSIDLSGWQLAAEDGTPDIALEGEIAADGFYLLERTDDNTISDTPANQIYSGAISNEGEKFILSDAQGNTIDIVDASAASNAADAAWFAGDNTTKQAMERIDVAKAGSDPTNWADNNLFSRNGLDADGNPINGTPGRQNSVSRAETIISGAMLSQLFSEFPEVTLTFLGGPYVAQDSLNIPTGKTLIVEPGVIIKFNSERRYPSDPLTALSVEGTIRVEGTADANVLFTSTANNSFWGCFNFTETSTGSELDYLTVERSRCGTLSEQARTYNEDSYWAMHVHGAQFTADNLILTGQGGSAYSHGIHLKDAAPGTIIENSLFSNFVYSDNIDAPAAIYIDGGSPVIRNSSFQDNAFGSIIVNGNPFFDKNTFENNTTPILMTGNSGPDFNENIAKDNGMNGILVRNWNAADNVLWRADLTYVISSASVGQGATLTIEPGAVIKFKSTHLINDFAGMGVAGSLIAQGASDAPIIFTSFNDDEHGGDTDNASVVPSGGVFSISIESDSSIFNNVVVRYGGRLGFALPCCGRYDSLAAVQIADGSGFILENSVFENNAHYLYWLNSAGRCEALGAEGDSNSFDGSGDITCEGNIPFP